MGEAGTRYRRLATMSNVAGVEPRVLRSDTGALSDRLTARGGLCHAPGTSGIRTTIRRRRTRLMGFTAVVVAVQCAAMLAYSSAIGPVGTASAAAGTVRGCTKSVSLPKDEAPHSAPVE
jgi:hypothetical protein